MRLLTALNGVESSVACEWELAVRKGRPGGQPRTRGPPYFECKLEAEETDAEEQIHAPRVCRWGFRGGFGAKGWAQARPSNSMLWYRQPAEKWTDALPIGNGRLGAMVFGGVESERLAIERRHAVVGRAARLE